jgi:hypothetical protein
MYQMKSFFTGIGMWLLCGGMILSLASQAQQPSSNKKPSGKKWFYIGTEWGAGYLNYSRGNDSSYVGTKVAMDLHAGIRPAPFLKTGILVNGWTIESYGSFNTNPDKGISVSNIYGYAAVKPFSQIPVWLQGMAGRTKYVNMHPGEYFARGFGYLFGANWEQPLDKKKRAFLSSSCNYGGGKLKELSVSSADIQRTHRYSVVELKVGIRATF